MPFKMPSLDINIHITQNGKTRSEPGHSWTRNAWNWLFASMTDSCAVGTVFGAGNMVCRDTANTLRTDATRTVNRTSNVTPTTVGIANSSTTTVSGIVIGSSNTPFDINNNRLLSQITVNHYGQLRATVEYDTVNKIWKATHFREFYNQTSTTYFIREVGLVTRVECFSSSSVFSNLLLARDVLETEIEFFPAEIIGIGYEISMDYSAID